MRENNNLQKLKMMKTTKLTLLLIFIISVSTYAQKDYDAVKDKEIKTNLGRNSSVKGFGSLELKTTEIKDDIALMPGIMGGIIMNDHFILGLGGYGMAAEIDFIGTEPEIRQYLYGGYGGLILGAIIAPREVIHVNIPILIGAGGAYITENASHDFDGSSEEFDESSAFFVIEPGIELEMNITRFFRLGVGASYRYITESDLVNITDSELNNYSGHI